MLRTFKYFAFLFITAGPAHAQFGRQSDTTKTAHATDTTKSITPVKLHFIVDPQNNTRFQPIDTPLNGWQLTKPVFAEGIGRSFLSDALTASRNLVFKEDDFSQPVLLTDPFAIYQNNPQTLKFFHGTRRYTELSYFQGPQKDQRVYINYGQLLSKRLFAGFDYSRGASLGIYKQHETGVSNLDLWLSYYSKNFRYRVFANAIWNKNSSQESGGLTNYSSSQQPETLPVNLDSAENRTRATYVNIIQFWSPSFLNPSTSDSTSQSHFNSYSHFLPVRMFLSSSYKRHTYTYSDQGVTDGFYQHFYLNAISTQDSIVNDQVSNKLGIQGEIGGKGDSSHRYNRFEASINHDFFSLRQGDQSFIFPGVLHQFSNLTVAASLSKGDQPQKRFNMTAGKVFWTLNSTYCFYGRNKNDYTSNALLGYYITKNLAADVHAGSDLIMPSLLEDEYYSNNFIWQNDFLKKEIKKTGATISSDKYKFSITADYYLLNNFIYFDKAALPAQVDEQKLTSINLTDRIKLGHWNLLTRIIYQQAGSNDVLKLPTWQTYNSLYYENNLFKSALFMQAGIDVRYVSSYFGDAYMPATRIFYLQNSQQAGGYETVDLFINMRIKSARVFFKLDNADNIIGSNVHYYVPGYPLTAAAVRFGISMRFIDP